MTHMVVPDSIEPYVGYKSLAVLKDGMLCSPQQVEFLWPAQQRAEARCTVPPPYGWQLVPKGGPIHHPGVETMFMVTASSTSGTANIMAPLFDAPPGQAWSWEPLEHKVAQKRCSCGIYAVDKPQEGLFGYIADNHVIVKVALWGTVTRGAKGARGQYAYPQEIVGWTTDHAEQIAEAYGIPISPDPRLQMLIGESVGWHRARAKLRALQAGGASFQGTGSHLPGHGPVGGSNGKGISAGSFLVRVAAFAALTGAGSVVLSGLLNPAVGIIWSLTMCLAWIYYCRKH